LSSCVRKEYGAVVEKEAHLDLYIPSAIALALAREASRGSSSMAAEAASEVKETLPL
jgi:hypothetical protein